MCVWFASILSAEREMKIEKTVGALKDLRVSKSVKRWRIWSGMQLKPCE